MRTRRLGVQDDKTGNVPLKDYHVEMISFGDMSFAPFGSHSQTTNMVSVAAAPVMWKATKQSMVATSTCEGELMTALDSYTAGRSIGVMLEEISEEEVLPKESQAGSGQYGSSTDFVRTSDGSLENTTLEG